MREARSKRERLCAPIAGNQPARRGNSARRGTRGINGGQAGRLLRWGWGKKDTGGDQDWGTNGLKFGEALFKSMKGIGEGLGVSAYTTVDFFYWSFIL